MINLKCQEINMSFQTVEVELSFCPSWSFNQTRSSSLAPHAKALVSKELDKDLVHLPEKDLEQHLLAADAIL